MTRKYTKKGKSLLTKSRQNKQFYNYKPQIDSKNQLCPKCKLSTLYYRKMKSENNYFYCPACNYRSDYNE